MQKGMSRREYWEQKADKLSRKARTERLKAYDRKHINSVQLRADRITALSNLVEPQLPYEPRTLLLSAPQPEHNDHQNRAKLLIAPSEDGAAEKTAKLVSESDSATTAVTADMNKTFTASTRSDGS